MAGPLADVRVLEITQMYAGPFCGLLLADMGAEVIKVEPPEGDSSRLYGAFAPGESVASIALNRGKKSIVLNLRQPPAQEVAHRLARWADAAVMNLRPDVLAKYSLDYETLSSLNPQLVYCALTAFGQRGPDAHRPGYDLAVQAYSGLTTADAKFQDGAPGFITATAITDFAAGLAMAWGVCAALHARHRTGRGQRIDTSLLRTALGFQSDTFAVVESVNREPRQRFRGWLEEARRRGTSFREQVQKHQEIFPYAGPADPYYALYATKDSAIAIGCLTQPQRRKCAAALGLQDPRLTPDAFDPWCHDGATLGPQLEQRARAILKTKTTAEWMAHFDETGVPASPIHFIQELEDHPQVLANDLVVDLEHDTAGRVRLVAPLLEMSETPLEGRSGPPALAAHTDQVLASLGYGSDEVAALRRCGAVR